MNNNYNLLEIIIPQGTTDIVIDLARDRKYSGGESYQVDNACLK